MKIKYLVTADFGVQTLELDPDNGVGYGEPSPMTTLSILSHEHDKSRNYRPNDSCAFTRDSKFPKAVVRHTGMWKPNLIEIALFPDTCENIDIIPNSRAYLCRIYGSWFVGSFSRQWYGLSFNDWGTSGIQLDHIDALFLIDD